jgi:molecular chaperone DnaK
MAVVEGGEPVVIANAEGGRTTPSVVAFTKSGERLVGQAAKRQAVVNPKNTVYSIKRFMGRKYEEVEVERKRVPFEVVRAANGDAHVRVQVGGETKTFSPPEISAMILAKMKADAEAYLGEKITQAVITVPAYFNDAQRQATRDAARIAGLEISAAEHVHVKGVRIINEPTAASLAYGLDKKKDEHIAVYDLGGGTFDISLLSIGDGVFEVVSTNGDTHLGGDDFDEAVMNWIIDDFKKENGIDLKKQADALQRIKEESEKAKIALSSAMEYEINLPFVTADATGPKHIVKKLTRAKLEQLCDVLIERSIKPVQNCLRDGKLTMDKVDELVLVGGMTRMPKVIEVARKLIGKAPHQGVNPDEVVAVGAAIQGGVLTGQVKQDIVLLDVTPLTLGVETLGGVRTPLIARNTTIPTRKSEIFSTAADSQTSVEIHVLQGEREMARDCKSLGRFHLTEIPPAPRGMPQIEVTFDIDPNGIVNVSAKDLGTGKSQKITITASSGLSKEEVQKMQQDAEAHAEEDKKAREKIEVRNRCDSLVYNTGKQIKDLKDTLNDEQKKKLEEAIATVREALKSDDFDAMKSAEEKLTQAWHGVSSEIYAKVREKTEAAKAEPKAEEPAAAEEPKKDGKVVDADFEVVDDNDKKA